MPGLMNKPSPTFSTIRDDDELDGLNSQTVKEEPVGVYPLQSVSPPLDIITEKDCLSEDCIQLQM